jgi:hypothetical protein
VDCVYAHADREDPRTSEVAGSGLVLSFEALWSIYNKRPYVRARTRLFVFAIHSSYLFNIIIMPPQRTLLRAINANQP